MIETATDALIFGLSLFVFFLMCTAVFSKLVEWCSGALRGWLG
jgi:hypothetical protein